MHTLVIYKDLPRHPPITKEIRITSFSEIRTWILTGRIVFHLFSYRRVELLCYDLHTVKGPLLLALILRVLSRRDALILDRSGRRVRVNGGHILKCLTRALKDLIASWKLIKEVEETVGTLESEMDPPKRAVCTSNGRPVYLRTDLVFGLRSGGSLGHIAGVLNNLGRVSGPPLFLTTDPIPTVRTDIDTLLIRPEYRFLDFRELPELAFNRTFCQKALERLQGETPAFVYQRYSLNNYAGLTLARRYGIPFVLEYNGSEVWIARNWGHRLRREGLALRIEKLNLRAADLVVVVSKALEFELIRRGVDRDKILVNPNGVDPYVYSPAVDGSRIRKKFALEGETVVGFMGTFGPWHGAEVLVEAFGRLLQMHPAYRQKVRLLLIGDGLTMPLAEERRIKWQIEDRCILVGLVPQEEGPSYLATCDLLVASHVPNPDGTHFFGSPTKVFEYMAMAKGIVASRLDQIGEILRHDHTAWLVEPGDPESLMKGLKILVDDEALRARLGANARKEVLERYTWEKHTYRIIRKLQSRFMEKHA